MKTVDIRDVEANLGRLIEEAEKGKPFTICSEGKPLVKVSHISRKQLEELPAPADAPAAEGDPLSDASRSRRRMGTKRLRGWGNWLAAGS